MDRRTKYTKKIIKDTLIKLLSEKDIKKVTVSEICKLADVNRATFYRYYLDVYDLLDKIEEDFINELKQPYLEDPSRVNSVGAFSKEILAVFIENKDLVRILFNTNNNIYFLNEVLEVAYNMCKAKWMSDIPTITEDEIDQLYNKVIYVCDFISGVTNDIKSLKKNYFREFKIPSLLTIQDKNSKELEEIIREVENETKKYKSISEAYDYFVYNSGDLLFDMVDELLLIKKTGIKIDRHYFLATDAILLFDYAEWVDLISRIKFVLGKVKGKAEINQKFLELYKVVEIRYIIMSIYKESINK